VVYGKRIHIRAGVFIGGRIVERGLKGEDLRRFLNLAFPVCPFARGVKKEPFLELKKLNQRRGLS
jgi:hypothetical protein